MKFRRLRAHIHSAYIDSFLPARYSTTALTGGPAGGFIVEQSPYIDTLSENCIMRTADAVFERFPNTEDEQVQA